MGKIASYAARTIFSCMSGWWLANWLPAIESFVSETALAVLSLEWAEASSTELSIVLAEDAFMRELNMTTGSAKATNVLSFPALKGDRVRESRCAVMPLFFWATLSWHLRPA